MEATDRAILDLLYRNAHDSGRLADPMAEFEIEMARLRTSKHDWNATTRQSLTRLMSVQVAVTYYPDDPDPADEGRPRTR